MPPRRRVAWLVAGGLALVLLGCGGRKAEVRELRDYVVRARLTDPLNRRAAAWTARLEQALSMASEDDLAEARSLVEEYGATLAAAPGERIHYPELRAVHEQYVTGLAEAWALVTDSDREPRQQRRNAAMALRHVETVTKRCYVSLGTLWQRLEQTDSLGLEWPRRSAAPSGVTPDSAAPRGPARYR